MGRKLVSSDQAQVTPTQHTSPCGDCPFLRTSLKGWLGGHPIEAFVQGAHGEARMDCHAIKQTASEDPEDDEDNEDNEDDEHWQCAGAAIYRANVAKRCHSPQIQRLPADKELVFATPMEFIAHHTIKRIT